MTIYIDKKYISLVSTTLEKFKWKKVNLANCRCPLCGDSELNKNKARGYFFSNTDSYFFKCHNCGASYNIYKFLEIVSPALFKQYCLESFKEKNVKIEEIPQQTILTYDSVKPSYEMIEELPPDHVAIKFLKKRKISEKNWDRFGFTKQFGVFARTFNSEYKNLLEADERILIPIYDEHNQLIGVQGRSVGNAKPKYITLKKASDIKLCYGLDTVDRSKKIYVVEGPIDSLFLPNAIAVLGLGNFLEIRNKFPSEDLVFILDNEPRSRNVANMMKELISKNEKVCIFPSNILDKDINDMVLKGIDVCDTIDHNTHKGAAAMMAFTTWRKCI